MAHHDELFKEGRQAYRADRNAEAALLYRSAASAALELGDRTAWFKSIVWAASATGSKGDIQTSLALLLEARQSEPEDAPQYEAWMSRKLLFHITKATRPERARLEQLLADLRSYATIHHAPAADLLVLEGTLFESCGDWQASLCRFEAAWQTSDGIGYYKSYVAYNAAYMCLQLGRFAACRDWLAALDRCGDTCVPRWRAELALKLALAEGQPFATLLSQLRTYADLAAGVQRDETAEVARELFARTHLLDPNAGDPAADFHPSRAELRQRFRHRQDVHFRYETHLLYLDYFLACLRYTAGVPATDDSFYCQPQQVPPHLTPSDSDQFQCRLRKARASFRSTLSYARHLDNLLECDWRQREVQARSERIEEIARAVPS